jgi:hypothetical protein
MSAEWMGIAYISGSKRRDQRRLVRERAINNDAVTCMVCQRIALPEDEKNLTATQKNSTEKIMNTIGSFTQPNARTKLRKKISIGKVTSSKVSMTILGLGSGRLLAFPWLDFSAACSDVDSLETKIEPALPGKPDGS